MMKDFLAYVAEDILQKYGTNLSHVAVVFPNKRASLFLNEHLARQAGKPLWSPAYITISELFRQQSSLQVADPIKQVCDLYQSFCLQTQSTESLDKFYGWGQLLLADFDDIDKNMADADRVFANLRDIHELDDLSYLTDEQRDMLRRFFSNFSDEHNTELKERFLKLWSHFADIYHDFNERLAAQGLAYEGALYRQVATAISHDVTTTADHPVTSGAFPYDHYLFVGFNLLQQVEQQLFAALQQAGKASFYWDFDHYYVSADKHGRVPEAGQYIHSYLRHFPNALDIQADDIYNNFQRPRHISFISAPTENIQARYISTWLREHQRYRDGRRTAIVLCNEALLPVVIHCLPNEVDKINVTTGYPLSQTPIASFIKLWFDLQVLGKTPRLLHTLQRHPYAKYVEEETEVEQEVPLTSALLLLLRQIAQQAKDDINDPLFQESLFRAYTLINRVDALCQSGDLAVSNVTLQRLVTQLVQQTTIPFHGEPAEGLQVMGVLETRNLDFDHVLLLSCNEGNMPRGVNDSSFIPHSIRHAYQLTTVENKVGIYAYYFHRLLQRASDVTILYNNSTEDGQRGEMSRFMLQLLVESGHSIAQHTLQAGQHTHRWLPQPIDKSARVMKVLYDLYAPKSTGRQPLLSPSAINKYMRCPLQFYYNYIAKLKQPETPDDEQELDNRIFGNIFHEAANIIYHQLPREVEKQHFEYILKTEELIVRAVDEAFHRVLPFSSVGGLHLINRAVIIHYIKQLLKIDSQLAPFTILGLECDVKRPLAKGSLPFPLQIGGRVDRVDMLNNGTIRVIDYKTGSKRLKGMANVDAIFLPESLHEHSDYYLQTFVYADIISQQPTRFRLPAAHYPVVPALLFIQHAGAKDYDPILKLGKEAVSDIAHHADHFNELLNGKISDIFSPDIPFKPTDDTKICKTCPYALFCRH